MFLLCLKIFLTRIIDVSLGTFRTILTVKGKNLFAGTVGFFEVFIWFIIVKEALETDNISIWIAIFYSLGFAAGTIIGGFMTNLFIRTPITLQIVTTNNEMADFLRKKGFGVSVIDVHGKDGIKNMLVLETVDNKYKEILSLIRIIDENSFVVVDEKKYVHNGFYKRK